jgi:hypothetical protein
MTASSASRSPPLDAAVTRLLVHEDLGEGLDADALAELDRIQI